MSGSNRELLGPGLSKLLRSCVVLSLISSSCRPYTPKQPEQALDDTQPKETEVVDLELPFLDLNKELAPWENRQLPHYIVLNQNEGTSMNFFQLVGGEKKGIIYMRPDKLSPLILGDGQNNFVIAVGESSFQEHKHSEIFILRIDPRGKVLGSWRVDDTSLSVVKGESGEKVYSLGLEDSVGYLSAHLEILPDNKDSFGVITYPEEEEEVDGVKAVRMVRVGLGYPSDLDPNTISPWKMMELPQNLEVIQAEYSPATPTATSTPTPEATPTPPQEWNIQDGKLVRLDENGRYEVVTISGEEVIADSLIIDAKTGWVTALGKENNPLVVILPGGDIYRVSCEQSYKTINGEEILTPIPGTEYLVVDHTLYFEFDGKNKEWVKRVFKAERFPFSTDSYEEWEKEPPERITLFGTEFIRINDPHDIGSMYDPDNILHVWRNKDGQVIALSKYSQSLVFISSNPSGKIIVATDTRVPQKIDVSGMPDIAATRIIELVGKIADSVYKMRDSEKIKEIILYIVAMPNPLHPNDWASNPSGTTRGIKNRTPEIAAIMKGIPEKDVAYKYIRPPDANGLTRCGYWNTLNSFEVFLQRYGESNIASEIVRIALLYATQYGGYGKMIPSQLREEFEKAVKSAGIGYLD